MKDFNKKTIEVGIISFIIIVVSMFVWTIFFKEESAEQNIISKAITSLTPVLYGVFIAYILNPLTKVIENKILNPIFNKIVNKNNRPKKLIRVLSIILTFCVVILMLFLIVKMLIPQLNESIKTIIANQDNYYNNVNNYINSILNKKKLTTDLEKYWVKIEKWIEQTSFPKTEEKLANFSEYVLSSVTSLFSTLYKLGISLVISIYMMYNKELFCAQIKKLCASLFSKERTKKIIKVTNFVNNTFNGFIVGKIIDSLIIGLLCYIVFAIFKMPYPSLLSVVVGVTNIIPCFGPIIGAIPCILIVFVTSPQKALLFCVLVLIIQQLDGNVIGPRILGSSTGISSFWVIFSIIFFGGLFGVFGMFVGVPLFAIIYVMIKTIAESNLQEKGLPIETSYYLNHDNIE